MAVSKLLTISSGLQTGHTNAQNFALGGGQTANESTLTLTSSSDASAKPFRVFDSDGSTERFSVSKIGDVVISGGLAITGSLTSINSVTAATSFTGAVTLGDNAADDVVITGSLASSLSIKTDNSFSIGAATKALQKVYSKTLTTQASGVADYLDISALALSAAGSSNDVSITLTPKGTGSVVMGKVDINGGAIDGAIIGAAAQAAITGTTITGSSFKSTGTIELGVAGDPGWADNKGYLYAKEDGDDINLYWKADADGSSATNSIKLTNGNALNVGSISFSMADAYADGSTVNITGDAVKFQVNGDHFYVQATNSGSNYYLKTTNADLVLGTVAGSKGVNFDGRISSDITFQGAGDSSLTKQNSLNAHANKLLVKAPSATTDNGGDHNGGDLELYGGAGVGSGTVGKLAAKSMLDAQSGLSVNGGTVDVNVASDFSGTATFSGGNLVISGGVFDCNVTSDFSNTLVLSGGTLDCNVASDFGANVVLSGGTLDCNVASDFGANVVISGGTLDCNVASDFNGTMNHSAGNITFAGGTQTFNTVAVQDFATAGFTPIQAFTAGSTIEDRKVVGMSADGKCDKVANSQAGPATAILGISVAGATRNDTDTVRVATGRGCVVGGFSSLTVGALQYLHSTAGSLTETLPTTGVVTIVGRAISATSIQLILQTLYSN
jgi:hypothetical protein